LLGDGQMGRCQQSERSAEKQQEEGGIATAKQTTC